jgi:hypothetical protein
MIMIASVASSELICMYLVKRLDHTGTDVQVQMSAQPPTIKFFDNNGMYTLGRQGEGHGSSGRGFSIASDEMEKDQQEGC